jgi:hypothetical protein
VNAFQKALLDAVLEEYVVLAQPSGTAAVDKYTLWADANVKHLFFSQHDGCTQILFHDRQKAESCVKLLLLQGYMLGL